MTGRLVERGLRAALSPVVAVLDVALAGLDAAADQLHGLQARQVAPALVAMLEADCRAAAQR